MSKGYGATQKFLINTLVDTKSPATGITFSEIKASPDCSYFNASIYSAIKKLVAEGVIHVAKEVRNTSYTIGGKQSYRAGEINVYWLSKAYKNEANRCHCCGQTLPTSI